MIIAGVGIVLIGRRHEVRSNSAAWALGLIVGVNLITSGLAMTMVAVARRKLVNAIENRSR